MCVQNHRCGLAPLLTCISGAKDDVLLAQIHTRGLGPIENCKSGAKQAVLFEQILR